MSMLWVCDTVVTHDELRVMVEYGVYLTSGSPPQVTQFPEGDGRESATPLTFANALFYALRF